MATVAWISLTPVKGLALHLVDEIELTEAGLAGDRRFFLVDENGRLVNNKGLGILQQIRAEYDEAARTLSLHLPDGQQVAAAVELDGELEASFHGIPKRARRVVGPWNDVLSDLTGRRLQVVAPELPAVDRGRSGAASLVSTASLAALAGELGVDAVDGRRFRMTFGIDGV